jgi:pilus assembly protein CpaE
MALLRTRLHLPRRPAPAPPLEPVAALDPTAPGTAALDPTAPDATHDEPAIVEAGESGPIAVGPIADEAPAPIPRPTRARRTISPPRRELLPEDPLDEPEPQAERPLRLVLVEEVPEVVAHVREMLRGQPSLRLVEVVSDGRQAVAEARELRADAVLVDSLLQGRVSGVDAMERVRAAMPGMAIVALGVPADGPLLEHVRSVADALVAMPFGTIDLARGIRDAHESRATRDPASATRLVAVYAAKGGVGKTTVALNLAVALAAAGVRTALVDGSLQYGDLRRLLHVDPAEPSICDLPTDCVRASDLAGTMRRGPAGIDILLAPPRLEMADLVTARDLDKILDLLRRTYQAVIVDTPSALNDTTLTVLDMADVILQVLTPEPAALDSTRAAAAAFAAIGYPVAKVRVVINRADAMGALRPDQLRRALGREPDHVIASDWQLVSTSNQEGLPFVVAHPEAPISRDVLALAGFVMSFVGAVPSRLPGRVRARPGGRSRASAA